MGSDCVAWSCGTWNKVPQLHATQSEPLDYIKYSKAMRRFGILQSFLDRDNADMYQGKCFLVETYNR